MKLKLLLIILSFTVLASCSGYQDTQLPPSRDITVDPNKLITIPVIVHILYENDKEDVSEAQIKAMIAALNSNFEGTNKQIPDILVGGQRPPGKNFQPKPSNITFKLDTLADGSISSTVLKRKQTDTKTFSYKRRKAFAESPPVNPYQYLNIYICDTNSGTNAYTPTETANHGIVIDYLHIGPGEETLTHETGHWLGLPHIFQGGCSNTDGIKDTPAQQKKDYKYSEKSCGNDIMATNFMGYSTYRDFFSYDQITAMRKFYQQYQPLDATQEKSSEELKRERLNTLQDAIVSGYVMPEGYAKAADCNEEVFKLTPAEKADLIIKKKADATLEQENGANSFNWQAAIINELSMIIARQFEKEVFNLAVNSFFKDIINPAKEEKIKSSIVFYALFPKTTAFIRQVYGAENPYTGLDIATLQVHIKNDLKEMPEAFLKNPEILFPKINNYPMALDMLSVGGEIIQSSSLGLDLSDIINAVSQKDYISPEFKEITGVIATISNSLRANSGSSNRIWIDPATLSPFKISASNPEALQIKQFYNLLYCQLSYFPAIKKYIDSGKDELDKALKIQKLLLFVNKLEDAYTFIKNKDFKLTTFEDQLAYVRMINESIYQINTVLSTITDLRLDEKIIKIPGNYLAIVEALTKKEYSNAMVLTLNEFSAYMDEESSRNELLMVAAEIAADKDGTKIKAILRSYVEPIGTSTLKRISPFNISLNSYAGINVGFENIRDPNATDSWYAGVAVPIGFSFSFWPSNTGSWSVFLEVLDLGSLVNVRFQNDDTSYDDLRFEHFLSPGAGIFYNFKNTPITIGGRYNYISNLRNVSYNNGTSEVVETGRDVSRVNFSILIDIPLFTILNKKKN